MLFVDADFNHRPRFGLGGGGVSQLQHHISSPPMVIYAPDFQTFIRSNRALGLGV